MGDRLSAQCALSLSSGAVASLVPRASGDFGDEHDSLFQLSECDPAGHHHHRHQQWRTSGDGKDECELGCRVTPLFFLERQLQQAREAQRNQEVVKFKLIEPPQ